MPADQSPSLGGQPQPTDEPGLGGQALLTHLIGLLDHEEHHVRLRALRQLEAYGITDAAQALLPMLADENATVRGRVVYMLRRYPQQTDRLIEVLDTDPDRMVRVRVVKALAYHRDEAIIPALARHLDERYTTLQVAIINTMGQLGGEQAVTHLVDAYQRYHGLQHRIARILGDLRDERGAHVILAGDHPLTMQQARSALRIADHHPHLRQRTIMRIMDTNVYERFRIETTVYLRMFADFEWAIPLVRQAIQRMMQRTDPPIWLDEFRYRLGDAQALADIRQKVLDRPQDDLQRDEALGILLESGDMAFLQALIDQPAASQQAAESIAVIVRWMEDAGHPVPDHILRPLVPFMRQGGAALRRLLPRFDVEAFQAWQSDMCSRIFGEGVLNIPLLTEVVEALFLPDGPYPSDLHERLLPVLLDHAGRYAPSSVVNSLARITDPAVTQAVLNGLRALPIDRHAAYRAAGYSTILAAHHTPEVIHLIRPWFALESSDAPLDSFIESLKTIGQAGYPQQATAVLRRQISRTSPHLRHRVIHALGAIGHPTAVPALLPLLRSTSNPYPVLTALEQIGKANPTHDRLLALLSEELSALRSDERVIQRLNLYDISVGRYAEQIVRTLHGSRL